MKELIFIVSLLYWYNGATNSDMSKVDQLTEYISAITAIYVGAHVLEERMVPADSTAECPPDTVYVDLNVI